MRSRPFFHDGERLSAARLNELVDHFREAIQRMALAAQSPGVLTGLRLELRPDDDGALEISPGLAIATSGRLLTLLDPAIFRVEDIERSVGVLAPGTLLRPWLIPRRPVAPNDPCAHLGPTRIDTRPELIFRPEPPQTIQRLFFGDGTQAALFPLRALDDESESSGVPLGAIEVQEGGRLRVQPFGRQVTTATHDGIRSSRGDLVATFRDATRSRIDLLAPTGGRDVQATHLALHGQGEPTARPAPHDARILELAAPPASGGRGGALAFPMDVEPASEPIGASIPLQLAAAEPSDRIVRVRTYQPQAPAPVIGVSASAEYVRGSRRLVGVSQGGLLEVPVRVEQVALAQGTWLTARDAESLGPAGANTTIVARLAQPTPPDPGLHRVLAFIVSPHPMS